MTQKAFDKIAEGLAEAVEVAAGRASAADLHVPGLTRPFRDTVRERAQMDPGFRAALREEAAQALRDGDVQTAESLLRDLPPIHS